LPAKEHGHLSRVHSAADTLHGGIGKIRPPAYKVHRLATGAGSKKCPSGSALQEGDLRLRHPLGHSLPAAHRGNKVIRDDVVVHHIGDLRQTALRSIESD
jgi:hypothetical protein